VPDDELDDAVDALATEILANSGGTNRIVKRLIAAQSDLDRTAALAHERSLPFGTPDDMRERMSRG
jgi:enoyl-CoA hydratase